MFTQVNREFVNCCFVKRVKPVLGRQSVGLRVEEANMTGAAARGWQVDAHATTGHHHVARGIS